MPNTADWLLSLGIDFATLDAALDEADKRVAARTGSWGGAIEKATRARGGQGSQSSEEAHQRRMVAIGAQAQAQADAALNTLRQTISLRQGEASAIREVARHMAQQGATATEIAAALGKNVQAMRALHGEVERTRASMAGFKADAQQHIGFGSALNDLERVDAAIKRITADLRESQRLAGQTGRSLAQWSDNPGVKSEIAELGRLKTLRAEMRRQEAATRAEMRQQEVTAARAAGGRLNAADLGQSAELRQRASLIKGIVSGQMQMTDQVRAALGPTGQTALLWSRTKASITGSNDGLALTTGKVRSWLLATTLVYGTLRGIVETMKLISAAEVGRAGLARAYRGTAMSRDQAAGALTSEAGQLVGEFGGNINQVQKEMRDYARQGKDVSDIIALTRGNLLEQKAAGMEAAEVTRLQTAMMKQYDLTVAETLVHVDMLNTLEKTTGAEVKDIAEAISKSAESAKTAGVTLTELSALAAVQIETTGQSGSSVGSGLKTLFTRVYNDKSREALHDVGVEVGFTNGQLKDGWSVLQETAAKWTTLTDKEREHTSQQIAGRGKAADFMALMDNFGKVLEAQTREFMSAGSAAADWAKLQDTVSTKLEQLKGHLQALLTEPGLSGGLSGTIRDLLDNLIALTDWAQKSDPESVKRWIEVLVSLGVALKGMQLGNVVGGLVAGVGAAVAGGGVAAEAAAGAAVGTSIAPGIGTIIGGVAGLTAALVGLHAVLNHGTDPATKEFNASLTQMSTRSAEAIQYVGGATGLTRQMEFLSKSLREVERSSLSVNEKEAKRAQLVAQLGPTLRSLGELETSLGIANEKRVTNQIDLEKLRHGSLAETIRLTQLLTDATKEQADAVVVGTHRQMAMNAVVVRTNKAQIEANIRDLKGQLDGAAIINAEFGMYGNDEAAGALKEQGRILRERLKAEEAKWAAAQTALERQHEAEATIDASLEAFKEHPQRPTSGSEPDGYSKPARRERQPAAPKQPPVPSRLQLSSAPAEERFQLPRIEVNLDLIPQADFDKLAALIAQIVDKRVGERGDQILNDLRRLEGSPIVAKVMELEQRVERARKRAEAAQAAFDETKASVGTTMPKSGARPGDVFVNTSGPDGHVAIIGPDGYVYENTTARGRGPSSEHLNHRNWRTPVADYAEATNYDVYRPYSDENRAADFARAAKRLAENPTNAMLLDEGGKAYCSALAQLAAGSVGLNAPSGVGRNWAAFSGSPIGKGVTGGFSAEGRARLTSGAMSVSEAVQWAERAQADLAGTMMGLTKEQLDEVNRAKARRDQIRELVKQVGTTPGFELSYGNLSRTFGTFGKDLTPDDLKRVADELSGYVKDRGELERSLGEADLPLDRLSPEAIATARHKLTDLRGSAAKLQVRGEALSLARTAFDHTAALGHLADLFEQQILVAEKLEQSNLSFADTVDTLDEFAKLGHVRRVTMAAAPLDPWGATMSGADAPSYLRFQQEAVAPSDWLKELAAHQALLRGRMSTGLVGALPVEGIAAQLGGLRNLSPSAQQQQLPEMLNLLTKLSAERSLQQFRQGQLGAATEPGQREALQKLVTESEKKLIGLVVEIQSRLKGLATGAIEAVMKDFEDQLAPLTDSGRLGLIDERSRALQLLASSGAYTDTTAFADRIRALDKQREEIVRTIVDKGVGEFLKLQEATLEQFKGEQAFARELAGIRPFANEVDRIRAGQRAIADNTALIAQIDQELQGIFGQMETLPFGVDTAETRAKLSAAQAKLVFDRKSLEQANARAAAEEAARIEEARQQLGGFAFLAPGVPHPVGHFPEHTPETAQALLGALREAARSRAMVGAPGFQSTLDEAQRAASDLVRAAIKQATDLTEQQVARLGMMDPTGEAERLRSELNVIVRDINATGAQLVLARMQGWAALLTHQLSEQVTGGDQELAALRHGIGLIGVDEREAARDSANFRLQRTLAQMAKRRDEQLGRLGGGQYEAQRAAVAEQYEQLRQQEVEKSGLELVQLERERFVALRQVYRTALGDILGDVRQIGSVLRRLGQNAIKQATDQMISGWAPLRGITEGLAGTEERNQMARMGLRDAAQQTSARVAGGQVVSAMLGWHGPQKLADSMASPLDSRAKAPNGALNVQIKGIDDQGRGRSSGFQFPAIGGRNSLSQLLALGNIAQNGAEGGNPLMGGLSGALSGLAVGGPIGAGIGGIVGLIGGLFGGHHTPPKPTEPVQLPTASDMQFASPVLMPRPAYLGGRAGAVVNNTTSTVHIGEVHLELPNVRDPETAREAGRSFAAGMSDHARDLAEADRRSSNRRLG